MLRRVGGPPRSTLRSHLAALEGVGAARRQPGSGRSPVYALTEKGKDLVVVARALEGWLAGAPQGPIALGTVAAKGAVKALSNAWDAEILRPLAGRPLSLTQLDKEVDELAYPALERRLSALRASALVKAVENDDGTPYVLTEWCRRGAGPIAAAAHFETRHVPDVAALTAVDIEAALMLAVPVAALPRHADGTVHLAAIADGGERRRVGVEVAIDAGRVAACVPRLSDAPRNWALGTAEGWLDALVGGRTEQLRIGGARDLVCLVVDGLHATLSPRPGAGGWSGD